MSSWIGFSTLVLVAGSLGAALLAVVRLVRGPTGADRIVALDILLAASIALCFAAAFATANTAFLDVAIGLAVCAFVSTIGWARLLERGSAAGSALDDVRLEGDER